LLFYAEIVVNREHPGHPFRTDAGEVFVGLGRNNAFKSLGAWQE